MSGPNVLIADDDPAVRRALQALLGTRGYAIKTASSAEEALAAVEHLRPDVILMDLALPGLGGLETCKRIRSRWAVPIIMLSVTGDERAKVEAFDAGADDYLTKPFGADELVARIRVALRHSIAPQGGSEPVYRYCGLVIDAGRRLVLLDGQAVHLTPTEYDVLKYLAAHAGRLVTHSMLLRAVWGTLHVARNDVLRYAILQIRKKLRDDAAHPRYLFTEPAVGYRLAWSDECADRNGQATGAHKLPSADAETLTADKGIGNTELTCKAGSYV